MSGRRESPIRRPRPAFFLFLHLYSILNFLFSREVGETTCPNWSGSHLEGPIIRGKVCAKYVMSSREDRCSGGRGPIRGGGKAFVLR